MTKDEQIKCMAKPNRNFLGFQEARPAPVQLTPAPKRPWVGLTDKEIKTLIYRFDDDPYTLLDEVNARLKEKNT
jgi:hypothetical protein